MLFNVVAGFIIPWLLVCFLIQKHPKLFIVISPITSVISMLINTIGFYFEFWLYMPMFDKVETISALPLDIGLYAVLGSLFIYTLSKRILGVHPVIVFLVFSLFTTFLEYLALLCDLVVYDNGWNIGWTFISYSIAYLAVFTSWRIIRTHIELLK